MFDVSLSTPRNTEAAVGTMFAFHFFPTHPPPALCSSVTLHVYLPSHNKQFQSLGGCQATAHSLCVFPYFLQQDNRH